MNEEENKRAAKRTTGDPFRSTQVGQGANKTKNRDKSVKQVGISAPIAGAVQGTVEGQAGEILNVRRGSQTERRIK